VRTIYTKKTLLAYKCHEKWHSWYRYASSWDCVGV